MVLIEANIIYHGAYMIYTSVISVVARTRDLHKKRVNDGFGTRSRTFLGRARTEFCGLYTTAVSRITLLLHTKKTVTH